MKKNLIVLLFISVIVFWGCSNASSCSVEVPEQEKALAWDQPEHWQHYGGMQQLIISHKIPASTILSSVRPNHILTLGTNYYILDKGVCPCSSVPAEDFDRVAFNITLCIPKPREYQAGGIQAGNFLEWNKLLNDIPDDFNPTCIYCSIHKASQARPSSTDFKPLFPAKYDLKIPLTDMELVRHTKVGEYREFNKYSILLAFNKDMLSMGTKFRIKDFFISDGEKSFFIPFSFTSDDYATENNNLDSVGKLHWPKKTRSKPKINYFNSVKLKITPSQGKMRFQFDCPELSETIKSIELSGKYYDTQWNEYPLFHDKNKLVFNPRKGEADKIIDYRATHNPKRRTFYTFVDVQVVPIDIWRIVFNDVKINGRRIEGILVPELSFDIFPDAEFDQPLVEKTGF